MKKVKLFTVFIIIISIVEFLIMLLLSNIKFESILIEALTDILILSILSTPLLYILLYKPQEKKLNEYIKELEEYKDVVNESSIVSKTDIKGNITFVNEAFCDISGYTKEELIGQPHSIIRHFGTSNRLFKELWQIILSKKTWNGIIKNKKKDGTHYWVDSTIKPILNSNGDITEFISVRNDITEIQNYKELLGVSLKEKESTLNSQFNYMIQYEDAVSKSSAITRINKNFIFTYVNDNYEKLTGYSKNEVVGKSQFEFPEDAKGSLHGVVGAMLENKIYTDIFEGIHKSGNPYYSISTVAPIKDKNQETIEYLVIKHDITDEINLKNEIEATQREVVFTMGSIGESRSKETGFHVKRVAEYSYLLAKLYGLDEEQAQLIKQASPMHDIGKVAIPDSILNKPGKLTDDEFEEMKKHSKLGHEMLKHSKRSILNKASIIACEHHERYDGTGYPNGLKDEEINIAARITTVVDVFDALGHDRIYKKAWRLEDILELFKEEKGKHFEPKLIDLFIDNLDKFLEIQKRFND